MRLHCGPEPADVDTRPTLVRRPLTAVVGAIAMGAMAMTSCAAGPEGPRATATSSAAGSAGSPTSSASVAQIPDSYRYVLESSCGERGFLGRYRVLVRGGVVASVKNLNDDYPYQPDLDEVPTLTRLVEMAESAGPDAVVELVLDDAGLPRSLEIDHLPNAIDDEECYEVSALHVLDVDEG